MAHHIQSAAYGQQDGIGWHGLGMPIDPSKAKDVDYLAAISGLDYTVSLQPVHDAQGRRIEGYFAQQRSDTGATLGIVGERTKNDNRQPKDLIAAYRDMLAAESLTISHLAALHGGALVAVSARIEDADYFVEGSAVSRDAVRAYLNLSTGYNGQHASRAMNTRIRVVCANTQAAAEAESARSGKRAAIRASTRIMAGDLAGLLKDAVLASKAAAAQDASLANRAISDAEVQRLFASIAKVNLADLDKVTAQGTPVVSTKARNILSALEASYRHAPGATPGTAWGAYNAVTHYATHVRTVRDTSGSGSDAARVASNLFGDSASMKAKALQALLESTYAMAA